MKKAVFVVLEMIVFLVAFVAGSILPGANKLPMWSSIIGNRLFIWDGVVLMLAVFVVILLVQAVRKVIRRNWGVPVLALVLTALLLAAMRFPFATITVAK